MGSYFLVLKFGCALNYFFFFNDAATTEIYPLSLHDALPISCAAVRAELLSHVGLAVARRIAQRQDAPAGRAAPPAFRSEEHTSELQSRSDLVCRLLLEKKKHVTGVDRHAASNPAPSH